MTEPRPRPPGWVLGFVVVTAVLLAVFAAVHLAGAGLGGHLRPAAHSAPGARQP